MHKTHPPSLEMIFDLIKEGSRNEGVALLYNFYYNKIYGISFSIVKNEAESEDIVQNVAIKLLNIGLETLPQGYVSTWLYAVVKNESLMYLRKEKPVASLDELISLGIESKSIEDFVDMENYYSMLEGLNNIQKQVVTLKVLGEFTHKEIAKMLGKPIGTIQWIYNTAIKKLKILLSSLFSFSILFIGIFIYHLIDYIQISSSAPEIPGQDVYIPFDMTIIISGVLFLLCVCSFIVIFIKSEKIPTKARHKSI